tara:strand:- start:1258 stop:1515 length:258 start_codon:yes stop_codon:yes gene_type:complete
MNKENLDISILKEDTEIFKRNNININPYSYNNIGYIINNRLFSKSYEIDIIIFSEIEDAKQIGNLNIQQNERTIFFDLNKNIIYH